MQTENFKNLIQLITGRDFSINTQDEEIQFEKEYSIYRVLPITGRHIYFSWKTPKAEDKMLRSFITTFTSKYREPNPKNYTTCAPYFSPSWDEMPPENKEFAYCHHASNMYSKEDLLSQIEANFSKDGITNGLLRYGFYETLYGIGIFCFWMTNGVQAAINKMNEHLNNLSIPYSNEFSDARWVYRFKIGLSKQTHLQILSQLN